MPGIEPGPAGWDDANNTLISKLGNSNMHNNNSIIILATIQV